MRFENIHDNSDATSDYRVHLEKEYTVGEFADWVLTRNEWGCIHVQTDATEISEDRVEKAFGHTFEYSSSKLTGNEIPQRLKRLHVKKVTANGGWGSMDYWISADGELPNFDDLWVKLTELEEIVNATFSLNEEARAKGMMKAIGAIALPATKANAVVRLAREDEKFMPKEQIARFVRQEIAHRLTGEIMDHIEIDMNPKLDEERLEYEYNGTVFLMYPEEASE